MSTIEEKIASIIREYYYEISSPQEERNREISRKLVSQIEQEYSLREARLIEIISKVINEVVYTCSAFMTRETITGHEFSERMVQLKRKALSELKGGNE